SLASAVRAGSTGRPTGPDPRATRLRGMDDTPGHDAPGHQVESAHTIGLRRAVTLGAAALAVLMVISAGLWWAVDGRSGLWGALLGAAIGGVFVLLTAVVVIATARTSPQVTGAVLLGTW